MSEDSQKKQNLRRLLAPRHVAFIGGADADYSARQCAKYFEGPVWGVNPKRSEMGGQPCFSSVGELPAAPDAVFLATPKAATLGVVRELRAAGAGGIVCFTAGYGETGERGKTEERELVEAAGEMALVGPNCYGLINYIHKATLWPFGAGDSQASTGVALIMQSGMITADMAMNQRSLPISYVVSAGNQASLAIEDYIDTLVDDPHVTGFGIYIEGIQDVERFGLAAQRSLNAGKPVVVLKAGSSEIGARLAVSHTGSLSGSDDAHNAFFERVGILRVHAPELLLETLKFMTVSGIPAGKKLAAFTCSGGEALMVADYCDRIGLELPQPSGTMQDELGSLLPKIATVSNPLDYTTPLWGDTEIMPKVFDAALADDLDAAILIQDYPPEGFDADASLYRADGKSFMDAVNRAGIPGGICSELSENFDRESREMYASGGVAPLQGLDRGLDAIHLAAKFGETRSRLQQSGTGEFRLLGLQPVGGNCVTIDEWEAKKLLADAGVAVPDGQLIRFEDLGDEGGCEIQPEFPVVAKLVSDQVTHKSDLGLVAVGLRSPNEVWEAAKKIQDAASGHLPEADVQLLVESMVTNSIHELLVGVRRDPQFGLMMVIASGGILVELIRDSVTLMLPAGANEIRHALEQLKTYPLLTGFRNRPRCNMDELVGTITRIADFAASREHDLVEMDVNPLMVCPDRSVAVDAVIRLAD